MGNIGNSPELKNVGQTQVVEFSLATSRRVKKNDTYENVTTWHNIKFWGKSAEVIAKYFHKGSRILIEGRIEQRSYEDKDRVKRYVTEIIGESFHFIDKSEQSSGNQQSSVPPTVDISDDGGKDDDLPF